MITSGYEYKYISSHIYWFWDINISVMAGVPTKCGCFSFPCIRSFPDNLCIHYVENPRTTCEFHLHAMHTSAHYTPRICQIDNRDVRYADWRQSYVTLSVFKLYMPLISIDDILLFMNIASSFSFLLLHL